MPAKLPPLNIAETLGVLIPGDSLERLIDELADPGCILGRGEQAKAGIALQLIGKRMEDNAKSGLEGIAFETDGDVLFKWRDPTTSVNVNVDEVRKQYPQADHPSLYKESSVKGSVSVTLPFSRKEILLPELVGASDGETDFPDFGQVPFRQTAETPPDPFA